MALPGDISVITLTGTYLDMQGNPRTGTVTFTPTAPLLIDSGSATMLGGIAIPVTLGTGGAFSVVLPCTSGLVPSGWLWSVTENISGAQARTYAIALPSTLGGSVDISTLTLLPPPSSYPQLFMLQSQLGVIGGAAALKATTPAAGTALANATQVILSWTAPADGNLHFVTWGVAVQVTSAETGGNIITTINGVYSLGNGISGGQGTGWYVAGSSTPVPPGDTFEVYQNSALTGGAAVAYGQLWAA